MTHGVLTLDVERFIKSFQDYLAPHLDTYEQAIYLYIFRHSRLIGQEETVIGFKSARKRMACGIGEKGKPMSENTAYVKLRSLANKGYIQIVDSEREGHRLRMNLPWEISGLIPDETLFPRQSLEDMDFFDSPENRLLILKRDGHRCFYCLRIVTNKNYVIEHVSSRPEGDNSYKNVVAACRTCNNRKNSLTAEDYLRTLYREGVLSETELQSRLSSLQALKLGELKPELND